MSLWSDQGAYGVQHCDKGDDCQGLSHCLVGSDLPDNYVPGRFFLLSVGLYFNLLPGLGAQFSGLWYHGGTAPLSDSEEVIPWATRLLAIAYTPFHMVCGESSYALASQAAMARRTDIFCLAPEMMKAQ
ncbi:MAG TPA: hypothetical protein VGO47_14480 [Chlamydiales bacterium]|nr:hypothetical protein [Chlamydiales bacterium]